MQEIQDKLCYVVIDESTMERVSRFYSRKSDAKAFITNRLNYYVRYELEKPRYAIAEFEFKRYYVLGG